MELSLSEPTLQRSIGFTILTKNYFHNNKIECVVKHNLIKHNLIKILNKLELL